MLQDVFFIYMHGIDCFVVSWQILGLLMMLLLLLLLMLLLLLLMLWLLMVLLLSSFKWQLAPCMGGPEGVLASTVAALELRVDKGMWLLPTPRTAA